MSFARPKTGLAAPLFLLGLGAVTLLFDPFGMTSTLRGRLFDAYERHSPTQQQLGSVTLVTLDAASLARHGRWPWPQDAMAALSKAIAAAGGAQLVFTTPLDRDADAGLVDALADLDAVVPVLPGVGGLPPKAITRFAYRGTRDPFGMAPSYAAGAGPAPAIAAAAKGVGALALTPEPDGVVRRLPVAVRVNGALFPGLAAEAARVAAGEKRITVTTDEGDMFSLHWTAALASLESGGHTVQTGNDGRFWIDFSGGAPQQVTAAALLSRALGSGALKHRIVVLDTPDDHVATPMGTRSVGAVIAQAIETLSAGTVLIRPSFAPAAELWGLILSGAVAMFLMARLRTCWSGLFVVSAVVAAFYGSWFLFLSHRWLIDPVTPGLALLALFAAGAWARWREVSGMRTRLRMAFSDSLPHASIEKIARSPALLSIDGETRNVTYLVCGVRGLAGLTASLRDDPRSFTQIMQQVLTPLMDQALAHGGTIDRLTADGFAAFWNAPLDDGEHALHACEAASGMSVMAARISEQFAATRGRESVALEIGVGIATGAAIAGGFGGAGRLGYSVNGDVVQLAGKIQALSPQYGPAVIVAEDTQRAAGRGFAFLEVDYIAAGDEDAPVRLFALLGNPVVRASPKFRALIAFHEHIFASLRRQQWGKARELIAQCRRLSGASQALYDLHLTRIGYFETNPPGPDWDGAFRQILK